MSMSKQSVAKIAQNYTSKAEPAYCSNCQHYDSDKEMFETGWGLYEKEKNIRCGIGGFAIKKQGVCGLHIRINKL